MSGQIRRHGDDSRDGAPGPAPTRHQGERWHRLSRRTLAAAVRALLGLTTRVAREREREREKEGRARLRALLAFDISAGFLRALTFAQRARWVAAILFRAAIDSWRFGLLPFPDAPVLALPATSVNAAIALSKRDHSCFNCSSTAPGLVIDRLSLEKIQLQVGRSYRNCQFCDVDGKILSSIECLWLSVTIFTLAPCTR